MLLRSVVLLPLLFSPVVSVDPESSSLSEVISPEGVPAGVIIPEDKDEEYYFAEPDDVGDGTKTSSQVGISGRSLIRGGGGTKRDLQAGSPTRIQFSSRSDQNGGICGDVSVIGCFHDGYWMKYDSVDFGDSGSVNFLRFFFSKGYWKTVGNLEFRLDSISAVPIATYPTFYTGGWNNFIIDGVAISGVSGVKTLYVKGTGGYGVANLKWFELDNLKTPQLPIHIDEDDRSYAYGLCDWGYGIGCWENDDYIDFPPINFGSKGTVKGARVRYSRGNNAGGRVDIKTHDGTVIGTFNPVNTGGWRNFVEVGFPVEVEGIHSFKVVGAGATSSIFDFDWLEFLDFVPDPCPGDFDFDVFFTKTSQDMNCNYDEVKSVLYSFRDPITCTITDDALMISLLDVTTTAQAESEVKKLCSSAYDTTSQNFEFKDISMKGPQFDNEYYSGGTYWNYEVQTDAGENVLKEDASRVGRVYEYEAQRRVIDLPNYLESFNPNQDGDGECNHNAAFCCWVQDRQANDNNGNCNTPYDSQCIDKDPGDNANFCYTDHARSSPATHVAGGYSIFGNVKNNQENIEGPIHCHGFAWGNDENDIANRYKGNNFFYVSMYDHMHQRGYVRNAPGSSMCACAENMAVVTRADCTEMSVREKFKVSWDASNKTLAVSLEDVEDINFNACQGANNKNNDLEAYYQKLVDQGRADQDDFDELKQTLVGKENGKCNTAIENFMETKGIIRIPSSDIQKDDGKDDGTVVAIDPTYAEADAGGDGEDMPSVPMEGITVDDVSEGEDEEEEEVDIPSAEASLAPVYSLKDGGEDCEGNTECQSGICMDAKCVGLSEDPESLADDSGKGDICESDADCNIDDEECLGSKKCGIPRTNTAKNKA